MMMIVFTSAELGIDAKSIHHADFSMATRSIYYSREAFITV